MAMTSMKVKNVFCRPNNEQHKGRSSAIVFPYVDDSSIENTKKEVAVLRRSEIVTSTLLGDGGFSQVYSLSGLKLRRWPILKKDIRKPRNNLKNSLVKGEESFAVKQLKSSLKRSSEKKKGRAVRGLVIEAELLSKLSHENIVNIYGVSEDLVNYNRHNNSDAAQKMENDYFIVMERLQNTMDRVIWDWKFLGDKANHTNTMIVVKINYALQIARALEYLHEHRIIYRDLKPQNIGLQDHKIKLFDFGLSRSLPEPRNRLHRDDDCYLMSFAGTIKYMAPEIFTDRKYNLKADVYGWSMVFYEMLTLVKPYEEYDERLHMAFVCNLGERPEIGPHLGLPYSVEDLLVHSWDHLPENRPTMSNICEELKYMLNDTSLNCLVAKGKEESARSVFDGNSSSSSFASWNAVAPTRANVRFPAAA